MTWSPGGLSQQRPQLAAPALNVLVHQGPGGLCQAGFHILFPGPQCRLCLSPSLLPLAPPGLCPHPVILPPDACTPLFRIFLPPRRSFSTVVARLQASVPPSFTSHLGTCLCSFRGSSERCWEKPLGRILAEQKLLTGGLLPSRGGIVKFSKAVQG